MSLSTKELRDQADNLFEKRAPWMNLCQEIAENFYPERADFTIKRYLGDDYAGNLMTSYPLLCRRDLGDSIGTMLRDMRKPWFEMATTDPRREDHDAKGWMQWATGLQRRAMYDPIAHFTKSAKQGDHDFAAFGQNILRVRLSSQQNTLLYTTFHLRDCAWMEDADGNICAVFRRWKPTVRDLVNTFTPTKLRPKNSVHREVKRLAEKKPFYEVDCLHMMVKSDMWAGDSGRGQQKKPWASVFYDCTHRHEMEAIGVWNKEYVISRWQQVGGCQYANSPAVIAALPDARLLQAMTYTLLSAGEKIVNPPMVATEQAVRSDVDLSSGGLTWVEYDYDERLGQALRPLTTDAKGMPIGREMMMDSRAMLAQCFYLNKIKPFVPTQDPTMTAFQAGQIVAQYVRDALPLFEPMEAEYNGGICEETFEVLKRAGGFGSPSDMPDSLRNADIRFRFQSPLHDAIESQKGQKFLEMAQLVAQAMALDKSVAALPNAVDALRDALDGIQVPAKWVNSEADVQRIQDAQKQAQAMQQSLEAMGQGADVAATLGGALKDARSPAPAAATV